MPGSGSMRDAKPNGNRGDASAAPTGASSAPTITAPMVGRATARAQPHRVRPSVGRMVVAAEAPSTWRVTAWRTARAPASAVTTAKTRRQVPSTSTASEAPAA